MTWQHRNRQDGRVFTGLVFLAIGVVLLLSNLNFLSLRPLLAQWWPLILVIFGVKQLLLLRGSAAWVGALFWIGTGALFLARNFGYLHASITNIIWPVMLIWFGVVVTLGPCDKRSVHDGSEM